LRAYCYQEPLNCPFLVATSVSLMFNYCAIYNTCVTPCILHDLSPVCNKSNTMGAICEAGTTSPEHPSSSTGFSGVRAVRALVFCAMLCRSLFVLFVKLGIGCNIKYYIRV
jgi:hypothetical protein